MEDQTSVEKGPTTLSVGIRFGLIMAAASVAYFMILNVAGADTTQGFGRWSGLVINIVIIFFAHKNFKDNGDGFMSFGQGFTIGFWISLISSAVSSVFTFIYAKYIDTGFIQTLLDAQEQGMIERGMSEEQVEQAMEMSAKFMTPTSMLIFGFVFGIIILLIISAVVGIFTQKKNPDPFAS
jgi:hypothetical protein